MPTCFRHATRSLPGVAAVVLAAFTICSPIAAQTELSPCDAYGAADAVFIGTAGPPVRRPVHSWDGSVSNVKFSPVLVERAYRGVSTSVVFITPAGTMAYLSPGQQYLIYGQHYEEPDMFMSADVYGTKLLNAATKDLEFLDGVVPNARGGTITGGLQLDESDSAHPGTRRTPLANVAVTLSAHATTVTSVTTADGQYSVTGLPSGTYHATIDVPELVLAQNPTPATHVFAQGCASLSLVAIPNGHIHGILVTEDGRPAIVDSVSLLPAELKDGETDRYSQSVPVDQEGRFAFDRVRPGRYLLSRLSYNLDGVRIPSVYYPGTYDRDAALAIVVGRSATQDVGEFRLLGRQ